MSEVTTIGSDFQSLPLDYLVSAPLVAAVQAQATAAATTQKYLADLKNQYVEFSIDTSDGTTTQHRALKAPLLSCVPLPHLRIDSLTSHFKFEISQITKENEKTTGGAQAEATTTSLPFLPAFSLKGNIAHESSRETTTNRSGMMEITIHASEAAMPAGLSRVLGWLTAGIQETTGKSTG